MSLSNWLHFIYICISYIYIIHVHFWWFHSNSFNAPSGVSPLLFTCRDFARLKIVLKVTFFSSIEMTDGSNSYVFLFPSFLNREWKSFVGWTISIKTTTTTKYGSSFRFWTSQRIETILCCSSLSCVCVCACVSILLAGSNRIQWHSHMFLCVHLNAMHNTNM